MSRRKFVLFSILPCLVLLLGAEIVVRVAGLAVPSLYTQPLPEEFDGMFQLERELFWSLRPQFKGTIEGSPVTVNRIGLRGPELGAKATNEFRILSLGESTTFGLKVDGEQAYSAVLQRLLNENHPSQKYNVINAGVPAYSSFQSLKFLESRGLRLDPDLVIFYHELNDYLPSSVRDSSNTEIGIVMTDRQLYESRRHSIGRYLTASSALLQFLQRQWALHRIKKLNMLPVNLSRREIGLPDGSVGPRVVTRLTGIRGQPAQKLAITIPANLNEIAIGRRVSESERAQNIRDLSALCRSRGIALVIIHPSYEESVRHECLLTRVCQEEGIHMFEAYDALHPVTTSSPATFTDSWHPSEYGHQSLARALYQYLNKQGLLRSPEMQGGS
jgi:lysophospholipase L1-like esterase